MKRAKQVKNDWFNFRCTPLTLGQLLTLSQKWSKRQGKSISRAKVVVELIDRAAKGKET